MIVFHPLRGSISRSSWRSSSRTSSAAWGRGAHVEAHARGQDFLVEHGYDEHYGARPLKRAIQKYVEDPLSEKILVGEFARGDEIEVDVAPDKERLAFRALSGSKA